MKLELDLIGRLGGNVEVKEIGKSKVLSMSVASTEKWMKNNEKQEKTTWVACSWWFPIEKDTKQIESYLQKGTLVSLVGVPSARGYIDSSGVAQARLDLRVTKLVLLSFPEKLNEEGAAKVDAVSEGDGEKKDDLPF